ncbi:hypothetical protein GQ53DRAFT_378457 [Thozetella sp. PMI_491]|nr:hypothetical protein GQ53DRAFT_378457 [Thozetella sp. PMI_491]
MDSLPVELLRLIFEACDVASVRNLRLVCGTLAEVGYDFLLPSHFTASSWRDDISTLHAIASHERLRDKIESVTFNFSKVDEYSARHTSFFQHWTIEPEDRNNLLQNAWLKYYELETATRGMPAFHTRAAAVEDAFRNLPNVTELEVTYTKCPYDIELLKDVFRLRGCRKWDRADACKNINAIVSAIRHVRLSALTIDQLPLEVFRLADDRRHWFDCARSFANLSRLNLVLDPPVNLLPNARARAINGLGHVLQFGRNLTHLSLGFHNYHAPQEKFPLHFKEFLPNFTFGKLTDLKLEGMSCSVDDLRVFLLRHAATLERLRLGGKGLASPYEPSIGGVHLHEGTFRSLFSSLHGKLPELKRFHMEGDMEAGDVMTASRELYKFHAVTDDNWDDVVRARPPRRSLDSLELERYLIHGGPYPKLVSPGPGD